MFPLWRCFLHDFNLFVIDIHQNMPISLVLTPFDYFQIHPSFAVTPNLILEPCHMGVVLVSVVGRMDLVGVLHLVGLVCLVVFNVS